MMAKKTLAESRKDSPKSPKTVKSNQRPARVKKPKKPTDKLADKTLLTRLLQGVTPRRKPCGECTRKPRKSAR